jgi:hypothetical protein
MDSTEDKMTLREVEMQRLTNLEFIEKLMSFSPYGAMVQVFVIEALRSYSAEVVAKPPPKDDPGAFFSMEAWYGIAKDVKRQIDEKYAPGNSE